MDEAQMAEAATQTALSPRDQIKAECCFKGHTLVPSQCDEPLAAKGHLLIPLGVSRDTDWDCANASTKSGCLRQNVTKGVTRFRCKECNYDFCDLCHRTQEAETAAPEIAQKIEVEKYSYRVNFVDGNEMLLELPPDASVANAYSAVAAERSLPTYQIKLIVSGQSAPLPCSSAVTFADVAGDDICAVATTSIVLGWGDDCLDVELVDVSFEHYSLAAYGLGESGSGMSMEQINGKQLTIRRPIDGRGVFSHFPRGLVFNKWTEHSAAPPVSGRVLLRVVVHRRRWAMGIGFGTKNVTVRGDPEYDQSFFGLYHGGSSINCCALGQRYYKTLQDEWPENRLAILIDSDARSMQCFCGLQPFGELFAELPKEEPLWPMIVCMACHDSVSISIASV